MESNTRFLLKHNNWSGLVIDGDPKNIEHIKSDQLFWRHRLHADCSFVTRENINAIITRNGIAGDIGLLSVDIDGNDYWVWEAINCINPCVVVCEYNGLFGPSAKLSTRYAPDFLYSKAHYSTLFCGASLAAFHHLGMNKGYSLVGSNTGGNNAFLVRNDVLGTLKKLTPQEAYVPYSFRTSRDRKGNLTFLNFDECVELIADLVLVDVSTGEETTLRKSN